MIKTLARVKVNDRVILPPFAWQVNYEFHPTMRRCSRRVLGISFQGESVTIMLDGHSPRTLPANLEVFVAP
jgi:hypothetical protein